MTAHAVKNGGDYMIEYTVWRAPDEYWFGFTEQQAMTIAGCLQYSQHAISTQALCYT